MSVIRIEGHRLLVAGDIGYEGAGAFAKLCDRFLREHASEPAVIDLAGVEDLVSPCLTAIYEDARVHRPTALRVIVPRRIAILFEPGAAEGLFTVEAV